MRRASPRWSPSDPGTSRRSCVSWSSLPQPARSHVDAPRWSPPGGLRARSVAVLSTRQDISALAPTGTSAEHAVGTMNLSAPSTQEEVARVLDVLAFGEIELEGRLVDASNMALLGQLELGLS